MFQKIEEIHQVPTHVDDVVITVRLSKNVREAQRSQQRNLGRVRRGTVERLNNVEILDEPEAYTSVSYTVYDQDGFELARSGGKAEDVLTEQEVAVLVKAARKVYDKAVKEIIGT